jgi:tRNA (guanosine-2'-O-)-methyltransferase
VNHTESLINHLSQFVTPQRFEKMQSVIAARTRYITVALEDIYQPHNASAVLRSCDGFGVQDAYIIEGRNRFKPNKGIELGTSQWLSLHRFKTSGTSTAAAVEELRSKGYRIVATSPQGSNVELESFDLKKGPAAFFFGNELDGLTAGMKVAADEFVKIPMFGFVESFNISVSCALVLHHLTHQLRQQQINWQLSADEQQELLLAWLRKSIKNWRTIESHMDAQ